MFFWRISNFPELSGRGAEFSEGRWHTAREGKRVVYLAEHPAVALLENLTNLRGDRRFFAHHFQLMKISSPASVAARKLTRQQLAQVDPEDSATTQTMGDAWLADGSTALLRVPSIPSPESWNYLLNPLHPDGRQLKLEWARRIAYDQRLFHLEKD